MTYSLAWLQQRYDNGERLEYLFFWGHSPKNAGEIGKFVFSQWYPVTFVVDGIKYKTSEHWMMAQKAILFHDQEILEKI